jgi:hypothetical protein
MEEAVKCLMEGRNECQNGQSTVKKWDFIKQLDMDQDKAVNINVTDKALVLGFELFAFLVDCPAHTAEAVSLALFTLSLLDDYNTTTVLQAVTNTINNQAIVFTQNQNRFNHVYQKLEEALALNVQSILSSQLSREELKVLIHQNLPYMTNWTEATTKHALGDNVTESEMMAEMSSHPVHLINRAGLAMPSAFIPFCAYKTNMGVMGGKVAGIGFPACDKFLPTVLDGELCYTVDLASFLPDEMVSKEGKDGELLLLLDYNKERSIQPRPTTKALGNSKNFISLKEVHPEDIPQARIHIHTLTGFSKYGAGSYTMSALKRMVGTSDFLSMPEDVRRCNLKTLETCQREKFLERGVRNCSCVPWEFPGTAPVKVSK